MRGHGTWDNDRPPVCGVVGRESGQVRLTVAEHSDRKTLEAVVGGATGPGTTVNTDEWSGYNGLAAMRRGHVTVCHADREWARDDDGDGVREVHDNTLEGLWTGLRNFLRPFRGVSKKSLQQTVCGDVRVGLQRQAGDPELPAGPPGRESSHRDENAHLLPLMSHIFMFAEPLAGWREVAIRETKTKVDWAVEMASLMEGRYANAERVTGVGDTLNTHTKGSFYESFAPDRARRLVRRIDSCSTPKHASWLNIAENDLSSLTRQCVAGRRFGDARTLRAETKAWSSDVHRTPRGVDWQMKIDDARCKLASVYPNS